MKIPALLLVLLWQPWLLLISPLSAQGQQKTPEPEPLNQFFFLDSVGDIRPLERQVPKGMVIQGGHSPIRFVQGEPLAFVVRLKSPDIDPAKIIQFIQFKPHGRDRVLQAMVGTPKNNIRFSGAVAFEATMYGEESIKIKSKVALSPGEYALSLSTENDGYCFGVDAPSKDLK